MRNRAGNKRRKDSKQHLVNMEYLDKDGSRDGKLDELVGRVQSALEALVGRAQTTLEEWPTHGRAQTTLEEWPTHGRGRMECIQRSGLGTTRLRLSTRRTPRASSTASATESSGVGGQQLFGDAKPYNATRAEVGGDSWNAPVTREAVEELRVGWTRAPTSSTTSCGAS